MLWNLLDNASTSEGTPANNYMMYVLLAVLVVIFIVWMIFSNRKNKQRQQEYTEQLSAIRPGSKVKTAGGICGIVVEVCDDNTVIIETGSEASGRSFIKMDKELIAQTDAKGPTQIAREQEEARKAAEKNAKKSGTQKEAAQESAEQESPEEKAPEQENETK